MSLRDRACSQIFVKPNSNTLIMLFMSNVPLPLWDFELEIKVMDPMGKYSAWESENNYLFSFGNLTDQ